MEDAEDFMLFYENNKAPEPDGHAVKVFKLVFQRWPDLLLGAFNICLKENLLPSLARLALISKSKGDSELLSGYRPLSMLNMEGKVLKELMGGGGRLHGAYIHGSSVLEESNPQWSYHASRGYG